MNIIKNCTIVPLFKIQTPDKCVVQATIENGQQAYIEQIIPSKKELKIYKKDLSKVNNHALTINDSDLWQEYTASVYGHSQSIGLINYPHIMPDNKFFVTTGPQVAGPSKFAAGISCTNVKNGHYSSIDDVYYISGFDKLLVNLQDIYGISSHPSLYRLEFSIFDSGANLVVMLIDNDFNVFFVTYDLFLGINDFINNLKKTYNDISFQSYKDSRYVKYSLWEDVAKTLNVPAPKKEKSRPAISYQGFTNYMDEIQNVSLFISSQFAPKGKQKQPRFIISIPPVTTYRFDQEETFDMQNAWTVLDLTNNVYLDKDGYVTEFENIDAIDKNSVLLTVAYHNIKTKQTDFSYVYKITW